MKIRNRWHWCAQLVVCLPVKHDEYSCKFLPFQFETSINYTGCQRMCGGGHDCSCVVLTRKLLNEYEAVGENPEQFERSAPNMGFDQPISAIPPAMVPNEKEIESFLVELAEIMRKALAEEEVVDIRTRAGITRLRKWLMSTPGVALKDGYVMSVRSHYDSIFVTTDSTQFPICTGLTVKVPTTDPRLNGHRAGNWLHCYYYTLIRSCSCFPFYICIDFLISLLEHLHCFRRAVFNEKRQHFCAIHFRRLSTETIKDCKSLYLLSFLNFATTLKINPLISW